MSIGPYLNTLTWFLMLNPIIYFCMSNYIKPGYEMSIVNDIVYKLNGYIKIKSDCK